MAGQVIAQDEEIIVVYREPWEDTLGSTLIGFIKYYNPVLRAWVVEYIEAGDTCPVTLPRHICCDMRWHTLD